MRKEITKKNHDKRNEYKEFRKKWAREQEEAFLNILEKLGSEMGIRITPMQYVRAHKICIETYRFGYPCEYKLAELIADSESYGQILSIMTAVMKQFRLAFWTELKKRERRKKVKTRKQAA